MVSTDHEDQLQSLEAQIQHYQNTTANRPDWELVDIYADEGISGRGTEKRFAFQRIIQEAEAGASDLIINAYYLQFCSGTRDGNGG